MDGRLIDLAISSAVDATRLLRDGATYATGAVGLFRTRSATACRGNRQWDVFATAHFFKLDSIIVVAQKSQKWDRCRCPVMTTPWLTASSMTRSRHCVNQSAKSENLRKARIRLLSQCCSSRPTELDRTAECSHIKDLDARCITRLTRSSDRCGLDRRRHYCHNRVVMAMLAHFRLEPKWPWVVRKSGQFAVFS